MYPYKTSDVATGCKNRPFVRTVAIKRQSVSYCATSPTNIYDQSIVLDLSHSHLALVGTLVWRVPMGL